MKQSITMLAVMITGASVLGANTCTWSGGNGNWSVAENWQGGVKPVHNNGDTIILTATADGTEIVNDIGEIKVLSLQVGSASKSLKFTGSKLTISSTSATLGSNAIYVETPSQVEIACPVEFPSATPVVNYPVGGDLILSGAISGSGGIHAYPGTSTSTPITSGKLTISGSNTFSGVRTIRNGESHIASTNALGAAGGTVSFYMAGTKCFEAAGTYDYMLQCGGIGQDWYFQADAKFPRGFAPNQNHTGKQYLYVNTDEVEFGDLGGRNNGLYPFNLLYTRVQNGARLIVKGSLWAKQNWCTANVQDVLVPVAGSSAYTGEIVLWGTNYWATCYLSYGSVRCAAENTLSPTGKVTWTYSVDNLQNDATIYLDGHDQAIDRVIYPSYWSWNTVSDRPITACIVTDTPARLTMNALGSAPREMTDFVGPMDVIWNPYNDYIYIVTNRAISTTGSIVVSNGTFALTGTASLRNAAAIIVAPGAKFELRSSNAKPVNDNAIIFLETGSELFAQDALTLANVKMSGVFIDPGSYQPQDGTDPTATKVDWLASGSAVVTANMGVAYWLNPVDGAWGEDAKWTVTPGATVSAKILNDGDFSVRVDSAAGVQTNLTIRNAAGTTTLAVSNTMSWADSSAIALGTGAKLLIGEGGRVEYENGIADDSGSGSVRIALSDGAELAINGGEFYATNFIGRINVASSDINNPSKITVKDGTFTFNGKSVGGSNPSRMVFGEGGVFAATNATVKFALPGANSEPPIEQNGGHLLFGGVSRVRFVGNQSTFLGSGLTRFAGNTEVLVARESTPGVPRFYTAATVPGITNVVEIADHASFGALNNSSANLDQVIFGHYVKGNLTRVDYTSDAESTFHFQLVIGSTWGYTEMNVAAGKVTTGAYGLSAGGFAYVPTVTDADVVGVLRVKGGHVYMNSTGYRGTKNRVRGFIVGDGWYTAKTGSSKNLFTGRVELESGTITNKLGAVILGAGAAAGTIVQNGGEFINDSSEAEGPVILGWLGGSGAYYLSNGVAKVTNPNVTVYVGGIETNMTPWVLDPGCPTSGDPATGLLSICGGTMDVAGQVVLAADGHGTLEIGPAGLLTAGSLVLSNNTVHASASAVKFTCDASGSGSISLSSMLNVCAGATLEIDLGDYDCSKTLRLITANNIVGLFEAANVTINGSPEQLRNIKFSQTQNEIRVLAVRGTLLRVL